ncbi:serine hydrolase [Gordonia sp. 852002-50816_SCH5313054-c]|nr:serine hydrolase [Gordonia sp. 852002-50816_SCH5313054-a]OBC17380.1 serine hydrolase [Gordonia sp. 852002-50816_SCH5313054-c]
MLELPVLTESAEWSVRLIEADTAKVIAEHAPGRLLKTASVGKTFLLAEVARQISVGTLDAMQTITPTAADVVADSGILYLMKQKEMRIDDLCLLIGAVSDNTATNMLLRRIGLRAVQEATRELGFVESGMRDRVRLNRPVDDALTLSSGTAAELCELVRRIEAGEIHNADVSAQIREWLAVNTDLSMVAQCFGLDPLAHTELDNGFQLWNKTGTISDARIDIGCVRHDRSRRSIGYAVLANWPLGTDPRDEVLGSMRSIGLGIREYLERI